MHLGIIGTGNMGTILIEALIEGRALPQENITIMNRTVEKAQRIKNTYPKIHVETNLSALIQKSDIIFLCIKPLNFHEILTMIKDELTEDKCIVSITSPITVDQLESIAPCSCIRAIPSITNRARSGVCLLTFGKNCSTYWKETIQELLSHIGKPVEIDENITRVASDIVSCGPAFFSYLLQKFIEAAVCETEIDHEIATALASEMLIGMGTLIEENYYTFPELQKKVTVRGGITGEGIHVLEESALEETFQKIFKATHKKFNQEKQLIKKQFEFHNV
ncbi:late competence protein ComER [Bacillus andreraoultii]|uniref:late competence protein ComER n=1 Tax=Bacillus andreraoultii TaxID=1499685 RepID=UPI00053A4367|nr:late competence protein ComER [Bacillus andreraoultii]